MRRTPRASASRLCGRVCAIPLTIGMLLATVFSHPGGIAVAEPSSPSTIGALVAAVANANQKLQELGAAVQAEQESVNKAIVDVETARDNAAAAQLEVDASRRAVDDSNAAITSAQQRFDTFAASTYINGPSSSYLTAADPADIIDTASVGQTLAASAQQDIANLQRARTEQVNKESAARLAKQKADQAAVDAQASQDAAVAALTSAQQTFRDQQGELDQLAAERNAAQAKLAEARTWSASAQWTAETRCGPAEPVGGLGPRAGPRHPRRPRGNWDVSLWDPTLPAIPSAFVSGDPDRDHQHGARHFVDLGAGHRRHGPQLPAQAGNPAHTDAATRTTGRFPASTAGRPPSTSSSVRGRRWACRTRGAAVTPPGRATASIPVSNTVGFDCSGLILYAFAGVGIKLPHYSGAQYDLGRKIPSSQMRRGDVIFYGPGGSQHVTLYLGNDQMLEAPYTGLARQGLAGANQRHDPVRRPLHRILMRVISVILLRRNTLRCADMSLRMPLLAALAMVIGLAVPAAAAPDDGQWDPTLPKMLSAGAPGDPVAIANASLQVSQMAIQTTQDLGRKFLGSIGLGGSSPAPAPPAAGSAARRRSST